MTTLPDLRRDLLAIGAPPVLMFILTRMEEIDDANGELPTGDTYNLLWNALLDEISAYIEKRRPIIQHRQQRLALTELLTEATTAFGAHFDEIGYAPYNVSSADLIEWFAEWRLKAKDVLAKVTTKSDTLTFAERVEGRARLEPPRT